MSAQIPPPNPEYENKLYDLKRREAERAHDQEKDFFVAANKAAVDIGQTALRTSILVNGGAAISMLAFIGHFVAQDKIKLEQTKNLASSLIWFSGGVACALAALGLGYFVNLFIAHLSTTRERKWEHPYVVDGPKTKKWKCIVTLFQGLTFLLALASLMLFVCGMFDVRHSIVQAFGG